MTPGTLSSELHPQHLQVSLRSAVQLNRRYIGIDISEDYCRIAKERIKVYK